MSESDERDRADSATGSRIRQSARALLVKHGAEAVTLRAIARELGITAPALYRYYRSHADLIEHLRRDIGAELAAELRTDIAALPDNDGLAQFFAACRGFRRWALAHPREFTLVFATPHGPGRVPMAGANDPFGQVFIASVGNVLASHELAGVDDELVPPALREDVQAFRGALLERLDGVPAERVSLGLAYLMVQYWSRIYGHVALEVFGHFPMLVGDPDALFNALLADIAREVGLGPL